MLRKLLNDLSASDYRSLQFMIVNSRAESSSLYPFSSSAEAFANSVQQPSPGDSVTNFGYGDVDANADPDQMLNYAAGKEVTVLKDDAYSRIKHGLGADDNHVLVIDRCGRLAYQIINPWSLIQFPYVKAAILSTYHDEPCGTCKIQMDEEITLRQTTTSEEPITNEMPTVTDDFLYSQINYTLNDTLNDVSNASSKIFILNEEESGDTDNEAFSPEEHFDPELLKSYNIKLPNSMQNSDTTEINLTQQVDQEPASQSTIYDKQSTSDSYDIFTRSTTIDDHAKTDKSLKSTTFDMDDGNNNKSQILDNSTYLDTSSNHLSSSNNLLGGDDMVGEIFAQADVSMHNEYDYIVVDEELHHKEYSTTQPITESELSSSTTPKIDSIRKQSSAMDETDMTEEQNHNQVDNIVESNWEIFRGFPRGAPSTRRVHSQKSEDHLVPIRIIFHSPHVHTSGRFIKKHEYVVLKTGQPDFHGHVRAEEDTVFTDTLTENNSSPLLIENNNDLSSYVDNKGNRYTKLDQGKFKDSLGNILESFDENGEKNNKKSNGEPPSYENYKTAHSKDEIGKHYQKLLPWINHILNHDNDKNG